MILCKFKGRPLASECRKLSDTENVNIREAFVGCLNHAPEADLHGAGAISQQIGHLPCKHVAQVWFLSSQIVSWIVLGVISEYRARNNFVQSQKKFLSILGYAPWKKWISILPMCFIESLYFHVFIILVPVRSFICWYISPTCALYHQGLTLFLCLNLSFVYYKFIGG